MMNFWDSLTSRVPFSVAKSFFSAQELPTGRGWDRTQSKYSGDLDGDMHERIAAVEQCYADHIKFGDKCVRFYSLEEERINNLRAVASRLEIERCAFSESYPLVLSEYELASVDDFNPKLVHIDTDDSGMYVVFSTKRYVEFRESVDREDIPALVSVELGGADELIVVRRGYRQVFDVVFIPHNDGYVEIRTDSPKDVPADFSADSHDNILHAMNSLCGYNYFATPLNLFSHIRRMYDSADDGIVVEMHFSTETASIKKERMRISGLDLRREIYHMAGFSAVDGHIDPYRISIRWPVLGNSPHPELMLCGARSMLHSAEPFLGEAYIRWCRFSSDYSYVTSRIFSYV